MRSLVVLGLALSLGAVACATPAANSPARVATAERPREVISGPHVAAGTRVAIRLESAVDLSSSAPGQRIEAALAAPLRTTRGDVLAPAGAIVRGSLAWTRSGRLTLRDAEVESIVGALPLRGVVSAASQRGGGGAMPSGHAPGGVDPSASRRGGASDSLARANDAAASLPTTLARGTEVELELTRALLGPGASIVAAQ